MNKPTNIAFTKNRTTLLTGEAVAIADAITVARQNFGKDMEALQARVKLEEEGLKAAYELSIKLRWEQLHEATNTDPNGGKYHLDQQFRPEHGHVYLVHDDGKCADCGEVHGAGDHPSGLPDLGGLLKSLQSMKGLVE